MDARRHPDNLQGQRLNILQRGVNIVGGKKIVAE